MDTPIPIEFVDGDAQRSLDDLGGAPALSPRPQHPHQRVPSEAVLEVGHESNQRGTRLRES